MAILIGVYGTKSKDTALRIKANIYQKNEDTHIETIETEEFLCIGIVDHKKDPIVPMQNNSGMAYGKIFNKKDYKIVAQLPAHIDAKELLKNYWGRFIAALWNDQTKTVALVRDPLGLSTLFYAVLPNGSVIFSTDMAMLYDVLEHKPEINWKHFTEFLSDTNQALPSTPFIGITELLPGVCCTVSPAGMQCELIWQPDPQSSHFVHESNDVIVEGLHEELIAASRAWLQGAKGITIELSGGVDSSGLLLLYKKLAGNDIPIIAVHHTDTKSKSAQEIKYARAMAEECDVPLHIIDYTDMTMISNLPAHWRPSRPSGFLAFYESSKKLLNYSEKFGCDTIISGQGGDHVFCSQQSEESLADYWLEKGLRGITDPLKEMSEKHRTSYWSIAKTSIRALSNYYQGKSIVQQAYDPFSGKPIIEATDHTSYYLDELLKNYYPGTSIQIKSISDAIVYGDREQRFPDTVVTLPLLSQPLVEYAFKIPAYRTLQNGYNRYFYRKAISKLTHSDIIWRSLKSDFSNTYLQTLRKDILAIESIIYNGRLLKEGIISQEWVENELQQIKHGVCGNIVTFIRVISCELWLKQWNLL